VAEQEYNRPF